MKATSIFLCIVVIVGTYEVHRVSSSAVSARSLLEMLRFRRDYKDPKKVVFACAVLKYRTINGLCNNLFDITRGSAGRPLQRVLNATYQGGLELQAPRIKSVTGFPLPNPRKVSNIALQNNDTADRDGMPVNFSHMTMTWGQFLDHDVTLTELTPNVSCGINNAPCTANVNCVNIKIPNGQELIRNQSVQCIPLARSRRDEHGEQINLLTSFLDASMVYGSSDEVARRLRSPKGHGLLDVVPLRNVGDRPRLPDAEAEEFCRSPDPENEPCFKAGDIRVNENQALMAMHTLWVREHNRIATILKVLNPDLNDETLFQQARKIVIAEIQHITYNEWLPVLFDKNLRKKFGVLLTPKGKFFTGYNPKVNPETTNVFSTAAFRMGHSLIRTTFTLRTGDGFFSRFRGSDRSLPRPIPRFEENVDFFDPSRFFNKNEQNVYSRMLIGLTFVNARTPDQFFVSNIHEKLIIEGNIIGDLTAINIQRGRDHGLPSYVAFREALGLGKVKTFPELLGNFTQEQLDSFVAAGYKDARDLDMFPAGIVELPLPGSQLGSVFTFLILDQFKRLRKGDRFWYETNDSRIGFTLPQLDEIRKVTLARILCDNLDGVTRTTRWVFLARQVENKRRDGSRVVDCARIPYVDLKEFGQVSSEEPASDPVAA